MERLRQAVKEVRLQAWKTSSSEHDRRKDVGETELQVQKESG